jgi:NAD-dependent dihydropyrimidine dehydrogenase PreA subunit
MTRQPGLIDAEPLKLQMLCQFAPGDRGTFIRVIAEKCTGCGECARFCVRDVWRQSGQIYEPENLAECVECGACWNTCPAEAIDFDEPPGGTGVRFAYG